MTSKINTIGIDARFYGEAGPGRYVKNIIQHLEQIDTANKYVIFLRQTGFDAYQPKNPNFAKVLAHYNWYSFAEQLGFLVKILKYKPNLLYVPHFNFPVLYPGKLVTAIPDIIMHTFSTERGTTLPKPYFKFKKLVYYLVVLWAVVRSNKVIVPSLDVKNDFLKFYKFIPQLKFVLAYEGIDPDLITKPKLNPQQVLDKYKIRRPFLLYVSSMYEHKNVERLVDAFKLLQDKYGFLGQLVLIGKNDSFAQKINQKVRDLRLENTVLMPGMITYVPDADVVALHSQAEVYVFPSLKEGFSLTPLEGMIAGLPAVISNIPCHKEIYGDSVVYFDPLNTGDMAEKINNVLIDNTLKESLIAKGFELVKKYNWLDTAKITLEVFKNS